MPCFFFCIALRPFQFCNNLNERERERESFCFTLFVFLVSWDCCCAWFSLVVPWVGLQCLIVVFSDHTHLLY